MDCFLPRSATEYERPELAKFPPKPVIPPPVARPIGSALEGHGNNLSPLFPSSQNVFYRRWACYFSPPVALSLPAPHFRVCPQPNYPFLGHGSLSSCTQREKESIFLPFAVTPGQPFSQACCAVSAPFFGKSLSFE